MKFITILAIIVVLSKANAWNIFKIFEMMTRRPFNDFPFSPEIFIDKRYNCFLQHKFESYMSHRKITFYLHPNPTLKLNYMHYWYDRINQLKRLPYDDDYIQVKMDNEHVHIGTLVPSCGKPWNRLIRGRPGIIEYNTAGMGF